MIPLALAAVALAGFGQAPVLSPAASFVAGKPVTVWCASSEDTWATFLASHGLEGAPANGLSIPGSSAAEFSPVVCQTLRFQLTHRATFVYSLAASILVLVHESVHLRGERSEGVTDCAAVHEMPRVAVKFFHIKAGKQLRELMAQAWAYRAKQPAAYTSVC